MVLKQIEELEKEKILKEEAREQENAAMFEYIQKLQEKDFEEFAKRKESQRKLAVKELLFKFLSRLVLLILARTDKSQS